MKTFIPSIPFFTAPGVQPAPSGSAFSPDTAGSSPGAFQTLMDGCMSKPISVDSESAKSELSTGTTDVDPGNEVASMAGMVLAGLQVAEATVVQDIPVEAEGMVSTGIDLEIASMEFATEVSPGMRNAEDVPDEGSAVQAKDSFDALFGKIEDVGSDAVVGKDAVSPGMRNTGDIDIPVKVSVVQTKDSSDAMVGKIADVGSDAVAEEDAVSPGMRNTLDIDIPVKESVVQTKDSSDAMFEKIAGVRSDDVVEEDMAPLLRQFQAASGRSESVSSHTAASDERNALKGNDAEFIPVREPAPSAEPAPPPGGGFAGAVQETTHPAHPTIPAGPAVMPQKSFDVGEHSFVLTRKSDTSVEVTLSPPGVGKLDIEVVLAKGVINANIVAADSKGMEAIERSLPRIVQMLADEGIAVGGFNVSLKGGGYGEREAQQAEDRTPESDSVISVAPEVARSSVTTSGLVSIFV